MGNWWELVRSYPKLDLLKLCFCVTYIMCKVNAFASVSWLVFPSRPSVCHPNS